MASLRESPSSKPALKTTAFFVLCGLYVAIAIGFWLLFVPSTLSPQTFAWITALTFMTTIAAGSAMVWARPTRSIAHVLYDVEHPAELPEA